MQARYSLLDCEKGFDLAVCDCILQASHHKTQGGGLAWNIPASGGTRGVRGGKIFPKILSCPPVCPQLSMKSRKNGPIFCEIMKKLALSCSKWSKATTFWGSYPLKWSKLRTFWRSCPPPLKNILPPFPPPPKKMMLVPLLIPANCMIVISCWNRKK